MNQPLEVAAPKTPCSPPCPRATVSRQLLDFFTAQGEEAERFGVGVGHEEPTPALRATPGAVKKLGSCRERALSRSLLSDEPI